MPDLLELLGHRPVVCAEGYLFECERRGYLQAGAFVPEVVLEHPEVVEGLHREFVHAGSDVVEAFTYYGHREKLRSVGREDDIEAMIRGLKAQLVGEIEVAGPDLARSLTDLGLIDEYRLYFHPVVLGRGKPFFAGPRPPLRLVASDLVGDGVIRLTYVPA